MFATCAKRVVLSAVVSFCKSLLKNSMNGVCQDQKKKKSRGATTTKCFLELLKRCAFVMYPHAFFSLHLESGRTTEYGSLVLCVTTV